MGKRLAYGHGINDLGRENKWYCVWKGILERCFNEHWLSTHESYRGTTVCDEWLTLSAFSEWCENNGGIINELQIDKDVLIPGNKHYSPDTCVFITPALNSLMLMNKKTRSKYGIGVTLDGNRFQSRIKINNQTVRIGRFDTPIEASFAYIKKKCEVIREAGRNHLDERVNKALQVHADMFMFDWLYGEI